MSHSSTVGASSITQNLLMWESSSSLTMYWLAEEGFMAANTREPGASWALPICWSTASSMRALMMYSLRLISSSNKSVTTPGLYHSIGL